METIIRADFISRNTTNKERFMARICGNVLRPQVADKQ